MDILYENMTIAHDAMKKSDILVMYFLTMSYGPTIETNHLNKSYYSFYFIPMQPFINDQWQEITRTKCEIYTRVMWYYRPVSQFNNGKKSEFYSRNYFCEWVSLNSQFIQKFAPIKEQSSAI